MEQINDASWTQDTLFVHGGERLRTASPTGVPTVLPIYTSTTYLHQDAEALDRAFDGPTATGEQAYVYGRQGNPSAQALETIMAQAAGAAGAVAFGSGMTALQHAL